MRALPAQARARPRRSSRCPTPPCGGRGSRAARCWPCGTSRPRRSTRHGAAHCREARTIARTTTAIVERLVSVRGIGRWTVEMLLIFRLGQAPDVLPVGDFGLRNGFKLTYGTKREMPTPKELEKRLSASGGGPSARRRAGTCGARSTLRGRSRRREGPEPAGKVRCVLRQGRSRCALLQPAHRLSRGPWSLRGSEALRNAATATDPPAAGPRRGVRGHGGEGGSR